MPKKGKVIRLNSNTLKEHLLDIHQELYQRDFLFLSPALTHIVTLRNSTIFLPTDFKIKIFCLDSAFFIVVLLKWLSVFRFIFFFNSVAPWS